MNESFNRTLEGLKVALQMEIDGKAFYLKASREAGNEAGRQLMSTLAAEEDSHRKHFEAIYQAISQRNNWPETKLDDTTHVQVHTIIAELAQKGTQTPAASKSELDTVKTAMELENKTLDYYNKQAGQAQSAAEKNFYVTLVKAERGHYLSLEEYFDYLSDPAGYFVKTEHPTLDGG